MAMQKIENIGKREKIILGVMAVAILYGMFTLVAGRGVKKILNISPAVKTNEIQALASDATNAISKDALSVSEAYALSRIEADWRQDPFYEKKAYSEMLQTAKADTKIAAKVVSFSYTGYMEYNGRLMAIINGLEYAVGEALDVPGYILRSISPAKVTIENKADSKAKVEVVMQDL
jgi:hypothetical protein